MKNASELRKISESTESEWVKKQLEEIEVNLMLSAKNGSTSFDTKRLLKPQVIKALEENGYTVDSFGGRDPRETDGSAHHVIRW